MTSANALMRLVAPEGEERPFDRYVRFKKDISLWYQEMDDFGLTEEEQKILEPYYKRDYGVPASQEQLMLMVMDPNISHFTLAESNHCRKVLAKKKIKEIPSVQEKFLSQCPSEKLGQYCWKTMMLPQMSYSFSEVHSLLYSFIGIQTLVIATEFPIIYWNTACLIVNSQSIEEENLEEEDSSEESSNENDSDEDEEEEGSKNDRKKQKAPNYGRVAIAIGKMEKAGIHILPPDVNNSTYTFSPDASQNAIRHGLRGIIKVGDDLVKTIIANRPYSSIEDFLSKIKINKPQMVNLIKSGAFDSLGNRVETMDKFITLVSEPKKRITLQNMKMLIDFGLIPEEFDLQCRVYNFNKYLKKMKLDSSYYGLDSIALNFFDKHFEMDNLYSTEETESGFKIKQTTWDKIYQSQMDVIRPFVKQHNAELLDKVNKRLKQDLWDKYCQGSLSKWEMDSVSFYSHEHELARVNDFIYEFSDFTSLPREPEIDRIIPLKAGGTIPLYKLHRIAGTVLDKDKTKKTVTLLTKEGVVTVKIYGNVFANYDKQISEKGLDGVKHVIEKSWFARGNKIIVCGIKRDDMFLAKKYKSTPFHLVELITQINDDGTIITQGEREETS